jgi:hypothetical protein
MATYGKKKDNGCLRNCGCIVVLAIVLLIGGGAIMYKAFIHTSAETKEIQEISRDICSFSLPPSFKPDGAINFIYARAAMFSNKNKDPFLLGQAVILECDLGSKNEQTIQQVSEKLIAAALKKVTITSTKTNTLVSVTSPAGIQISRRQTVITVEETDQPLKIYEGFFTHNKKLIHAIFGSFDPALNIKGLDFVNSLGPPTQ